MFKPRDPAEYRWLGRALDERRIPVVGRTRRRLMALAPLVQLPLDASVGTIAHELKTFTPGRG